MKNKSINIEDFYFQFVKNNGRMPTNLEVSQQLKLELEDVDAFQNSLIEKYENTKLNFAVFHEKVLLALLNKALKGNVPAIALYLKTVLNETEKTESKTESEITVTKVVFENL